MTNYQDSENGNTSFRIAVERAKILLPLEEMLVQLEDWEQCVEIKLCPFHEDNSPSFSVFTMGEHQYWKCHAGCGAGDQINYLEKKFSLDRGGALRLFFEMARVADDGGGRISK